MTTGSDALRNAVWFTSSYSNDHGGACVEGARLTPHTMAVRDSKNPTGPTLTIPATAFATFVAGVKTGELGTV